MSAIKAGYAFGYGKEWTWRQRKHNQGKLVPIVMMRCDSRKTARAIAEALRRLSKWDAACCEARGARERAAQENTERKELARLKTKYESPPEPKVPQARPASYWMRGTRATPSPREEDCHGT